MGYADLTAAKAELGLTDNDPDDTDAIGRLTSLDDALSLRFDAATDRTWGDFSAEVRTVESWCVSRLLVLDDPLTALTSVETGGTWNGTTWDDGITVDGASLRLRYGGHAIERRDGPYWCGPVRVTGAWGDETDDSPPADVVAGVTEAVVAEYRRRTFNARDTAASFDDLEARPPAKYENGPLWQAAIKTHRRIAVVVA